MGCGREWCFFVARCRGLITLDETASGERSLLERGGSWDKGGGVLEGGNQLANTGAGQRPDGKNGIFRRWGVKWVCMDSAGTGPGCENREGFGARLGSGGSSN